MSLPSPEPMSREELDTLFPDGVPVLLVKLLFPTVSEELTVGDLRQIARALAADNANQRTLLSHAPATEIETEAMDRAWRAWIETSSCRTAVGHFAFAAGYAAAKDATPPPQTHVLGQEQCAVLIDQMLSEPIYRDHPQRRMALTIAARAIRRGRHLTAEERVNNVLDWISDEQE